MPKKIVPNDRSAKTRSPEGLALLPNQQFISFLNLYHDQKWTNLIIALFLPNYLFRKQFANFKFQISTSRQQFCTDNSKLFQIYRVEKIENTRSIN